MVYESHMHTPLCRHARGEVVEYAAAAESRGLAGIIVTDHNPLPGGLAQGSRMYGEQLEAYLAMVEGARQAWRGRVDVRLGLECDYLPELEGFLAEQAGSAGFDFVLGSVHPHLDYYRERYWRGDAVAFQRQYFEHLAQAAETGLFDSLAHPDLVRATTGDQWRIERVMDDICRALDRIAAAGTAMELNTSGWRESFDEMKPGPAMLREMALRGIDVTLGSDAHDPGRVGHGWEAALDLLEEVGYEGITVFLERKGRTVPIGEVRARLVADVGS